MDKKKILIVDDEQDLVETLSFRLEANGYTVIKANDGQVGLDKARSEKPDLIILDLMLPKIDGYKVCRMLKFDEKYKNIPIIMFTARAQETDKKMGEEVGADGYITKPFEPAVLLGKIKELLMSFREMDKRHILVVDDERDLVDLLRMRLQAHDYAVTVAYDGLEALEKAKANPDIILLDVMLPGLNGYEVCNRLRENKATHQIPVIMLTGKDTSKDKIEGLYIGADDYITKPFDGEEMLARIETILRRGESFEKRDKDRLLAIDEIKRIISEDAIIPHFQPIYNLKPRRLLGLEVLSRPPAKSYFVNPEVLFDTAFHLGMLFDLEMACHKKALDIIGKRAPGFKIFFNINPYLVQDSRFKDISALYGSYKQAGEIVLELTERTAINDFNFFVRTSITFKNKGFKVAIDDIGSGYASLNSIVEIKPDFIKIDLPLIRDIQCDAVRQNLVRAIVMFCKECKISFIAEGVECQEQLDTLIALGVGAAQGYFLGKPSPEIQKLI